MRFGSEVSADTSRWKAGLTEVRREGRVCKGRWRFRRFWHRDAHGVKNEQNTRVRLRPKAEFLKIHILAAHVFLRPPLESP